MESASLACITGVLIRPRRIGVDDIVSLAKSGFGSAYHGGVLVVLVNETKHLVLCKNSLDVFKVVKDKVEKEPLKRFELLGDILIPLFRWSCYFENRPA